VWVPSDASEFYRLYAEQCVELARQPTDSASKATLLTMAQQWIVLADQADKNSKTSTIVYETAEPRQPVAQHSNRNRKRDRPPQLAASFISESGSDKRNVEGSRRGPTGRRSWSNLSRLRSRPLMPSMPAFLYRCPNAGLNVQGWIADDPSQRGDENYMAILCTACVCIHLVNPKTGKVRPHCMRRMMGGNSDQDSER
jgi:hypothetical protein